MWLVCIKVLKEEQSVVLAVSVCYFLLHYRSAKKLQAMYVAINNSNNFGYLNALKMNKLIF